MIKTMENPTPSDSELLTVWLACRSEPAFRALVTRYAALVHMAAKRTCGDDALAADASQLVFILLAQKAKSLTSRSSLAGWLHTAAVMHAKRLIAKSRREIRKLQHLHTAMEPPTHLSFERPWLEIQPVLDQALSSLSAKDRETLLLKFYRSLSVREIATTLGIGADAAQKRLDRATERLRHKLARRGVHTASTSLAAILVAGFASDAQAVSHSVSRLTAKAVAANTISTSLITSITLIFMTHRTTLITATAAVLTATVITTALIGGNVRNTTTARASYSDSRSSEEPITYLKAGEELSTAVQKIPRLRPSTSPETTALNEKFGKSRVSLAQRYVQDAQVTITTKTKILDNQLRFFTPENKNEDQLAKVLFGDFSEALHLTHEQSAAIKKLYSEVLVERIKNLTIVSDGVAKDSVDLTELLLEADASKNNRLLPAGKVASNQEASSNPTGHLIGLLLCNEFYVSPSILDETRMSAILSNVFNPQQEEAYRKKLSEGSIKLIGPIQPLDTAFIQADFNSKSNLEDLCKKMSDTRQGMDQIMRSWKN